MSLRMGLIGTGSMGMRHAEACARSEDVGLTVVCARTVENARAVGEQWGVPAVTDYRSLGAADVDAVVVAVPTTLHEEVATHFLKQGVHVLLEKPMAASTTEARRLHQLALGVDAVLQIGHIERFNPAVKAAQAWLEQHPTKQARRIRAYRMGPFDPRVYDVGVVLDLMIHDIDLVAAFTGGEIRELQAQCTSIFSNDEDLAMARIRLTTGVDAQLTTARMAQEKGRIFRIETSGELLAIDCMRRQVALEFEGSDSQLPVADVQPLDLQLASFVRAVRTGGDPEVTAQDGLWALQVCEAVLEVCRGGEGESDA